MRVVDEKWIRTKADEEAVKQGCWFDEEHAEHIVWLVETFFRSKFIKGPIRLLDWQKNFIKQLHGWKDADNNRRFKFANLHISKKNGKTLLISILAFLELLFSEEPSPIVAAASASRENAGQVYDEVSHALTRGPLAPDQDDESEIKLTPHKKQLIVNRENDVAEFRSLSSDGKRVHGYNCSLILIDELAQHRNAELYEALNYAPDARPNGLCVTISTAGNNPSHFYHTDIYSKSKRILAGTDLDTQWYGEVYEADPNADYENDPEQWRRANPSLGTSFTEEAFRKKLNTAKNTSVGAWLNFQRLKLGIWRTAEELCWLEVVNFNDHYLEVDEETLQERPASVGVDLSESVDPSSVSICYDLGDGTYYFRSRAWVAEAGVKLREEQSLPLYATFPDLKITKGDMIDGRLVREFVLELCRTYEVREVNFDPRSAYSMAFDIESEGYTTQRIPQNARHFSPIMKEFANMYKAGKIKHDGSSWFRYCLSNVRVEVNSYDEIRPYRKKSVDKIDGAISALLAFRGVLTQSQPQGPSVLW